MEFDDPQLQKLYQRFVQLEKSYEQHINSILPRKEVDEALERFKKLERDFRSHDEGSTIFRSRLESLSKKVDDQIRNDQERLQEYISAQQNSTIALNKINRTIERQVEDTSDMVVAWKNVKGSIEVLNVIGKVGTWLLRAAGIIMIMGILFWGWVEKVGPGIIPGSNVEKSK